MMAPVDDQCPVTGIAEPVHQMSVRSAVIHVRDDAGDRLARAVVDVGLSGEVAEQRLHIEAETPAILVVVAAERVLRHLRNAGKQRRSGFLRPADIVADRIPLSGHSKVERAHVLQEAVQVLDVDRISEHRSRCAMRTRRRGRAEIELAADLVAGGRRREILYTRTP